MGFYNDSKKKLPEKVLDLIDQRKKKEKAIDKLKENIIDLDIQLNYLIYKLSDDELQKKN
tara:strand:- start:2184 stop:2363 length:180 start_codon:yes stop_codon:yes gene_type:complete